MRFFPDVLSSLGEAIIITDARGRVEYMNVMAQNLTGWSLSEAANQSVSSVFLLQNELTGDPEESPAEIYFRKGNAERRTDHTILCHRSGVEYVIEHATALVRDDGGQIRGSVVVFRDLKGRRILLNQVIHRAHFDPLTDLPNRYLFQDRFSQLIALSRRHNHLVALLYLDIDHFKRINDMLGHAFRDQVLKEIGSRLLTVVRESDTVARLGDDEFTILVGEIGNRDQAVLFAKKVLAAVAIPIIVDRQECHLTVSMGVVLYPDDGNTTTALVRNADISMYKAKEKGGNNIQFFSLS